MFIDLQTEIRHLHSKIIEKKISFEEGIKKDQEFEELKKIYLEIKELESRLVKCFEHSDNTVTAASVSNGHDQLKKKDN